MLHGRYRRVNYKFTIGDTFTRNNGNTVRLTRLMIGAVSRRPSTPLCFACSSSRPMRGGVRSITFGLCSTNDMALDSSTGSVVRRVGGLNTRGFPVYVTGARCDFSASTGTCNPARNFRLRIHSVAIGVNTRVVMIVTNPVVHVPNLPGDPRTRHVSIIGNRVANLSWVQWGTTSQDKGRPFLVLSRARFAATV